VVKDLFAIVLFKTGNGVYCDLETTSAVPDKKGSEPCDHGGPESLEIICFNCYAARDKRG